MQTTFQSRKVRWVEVKAQYSRPTVRHSRKSRVLVDCVYHKPYLAMEQPEA